MNKENYFAKSFKQVWQEMGKPPLIFEQPKGDESLQRRNREEALNNLAIALGRVQKPD